MSSLEPTLNVLKMLNLQVDIPVGHVFLNRRGRPYTKDCRRW